MTIPARWKAPSSIFEAVDHDVGTPREQTTQGMCPTSLDWGRARTWVVNFLRQLCKELDPSFQLVLLLAVGMRKRAWRVQALESCQACCSGRQSHRLALFPLFLPLRLHALFKQAREQAISPVHPDMPLACAAGSCYCKDLLVRLYTVPDDERCKASGTGGGPAKRPTFGVHCTSTFPYELAIADTESAARHGTYKSDLRDWSRHC